MTWILPDCLQDTFIGMPACCIVIYRTVKFSVMYLHILEACVCHNLTSQKKIYFYPHLIFFSPLSRSFLSYCFLVSFIFTSYILSLIYFSLLLPISRYDFLLLFFLSFSFFFLVTSLLAFLLFLQFLSSHVCMNLAVCNSGHPTLFSSG